ncbi:hypothetical protein [Acetivibrio cellulolyticus]|uniref:hypothetical protein n=1 Tax=Acetivibrio cellulolyticus TaxID=35830 RepID=UPI0001E2BE84|nr:hypothetical protein [Acetivibrio cellulolyticus]
MTNAIAVYLANVLIVIVILLIFALEAYLSLRKNIVLTLIMPVISFFLAFWQIIRFVKQLIVRGHFDGDSFIPILLFAILSFIFIVCRKKVRGKVALR